MLKIILEDVAADRGFAALAGFSVGGTIALLWGDMGTLSLVLVSFALAAVGLLLALQNGIIRQQHDAVVSSNIALAKAMKRNADLNRWGSDG